MIRAYKDNALNVLIGFIVVSVLALGVVLPASAMSGSGLMCFQGTGDGYGSNGTCVLNGDGSALINTIDNDEDPNNAYGGVYYETSSLSGLKVGDVDQLEFSYYGQGAVGGSPRFTIPIDVDGDGVFNHVNWGGNDLYAYVDTMGCNDGDINQGTLDVVGDATCTVQYNGMGYSNWAAFATANPTLTIAADSVPFVVVDQPGEFTISNVKIGAVALSAKDACKNNGWKTMTRLDGSKYKNQGQCVSSVVANAKALLNRHNKS